MNLFFFSRREGLARHLNLSHPLALAAAGVVALSILGAAFALGIQFGARGAIRTPSSFSELARNERVELEHVRAQVRDRIDGLALRVGQMNAQLIRLDALGKRLTQMANINSREFNFDSEPGRGGPDDGADAGGSAALPDVSAMMDAVAHRIDSRDSQLLALENVILSRRLNESIQPEGRPVLDGYISSYYGERQDPFDGHDAIHKGVDFAGDMGSPVVAVAAGVVTSSEYRQGYGNLIEVNHGNGYVTRYGHNQSGLVSVGQTVMRGQPVALMGSTGRSTGPHVHFEVLKGGRQVDPLSFIGR
jgi:murein DD-endopeptidase MepM/ murein hydrolase activator NlpD